MKKLILTIVILCSFLSKNYCQELLVYSFQDSAINIAKTSGSIYILKGNKCCKKCFEELDEALGMDSITYCITHVDSSIYSRKIDLQEIKKLMPMINKSYFDFRNSTEQYGYCDCMNDVSVFRKYRVDITPALLLVVRDRIVYYPYYELYYNNQIDKKIISEIRNRISQK